MRRRLIAILTVTVLGACGGTGTATTTGGAGPSAPVLAIEGRSFGQPPSVAAGEKFTISNLDGVRHTFTSPDGNWEEVDIAENSTAEFTVPADLAPGTYAFVCTVHPSMAGNLTVSG